MGRKWHAVAALAIAYTVIATVADDKGHLLAGTVTAPEGRSSMRNVTTYHHVWPAMKFGWRVVLGSFIVFFGAAFGSIGGVGGGGIFVPMLTLIIGFDTKSSAAISKCMIMGGAVSTVYCNLKLKHPSLDMPLIDYDLALLIQPMLMLGVSIGVICNVIFPDWLVTVLLISLFLVTSTKAFLKGVETWKKEMLIKREATKQSEQTSNIHKHVALHSPNANNCSSYFLDLLGGQLEYTLPSSGPDDAASKAPSDEAVSIWKNIYWKEFGLLAFVWIAFLAIQIIKDYVATCSTWYWVLNLLQIPVSVGVTMYQAVGLAQGKRVISSKANNQTRLRAYQLFVYCSLGLTAGSMGGLLGVGGGIIMGPLFLELGVPPQVSSATSTFAMMFSASMSVVEYYLLKRFPVPYALFFAILAFLAAIVGQQVVRKMISWLGRASLIIFVLSFMIFISALSLGGVGTSNMIHKITQHEYLGFENMCKYDA